MTTIHIDRFSAGLDDLTNKQQADVVTVLRVLDRTKRYSAFEATDNMVIARMMTRLHHKAYMHYGVLIKDAGGDYPWTNVELTEGGRKLLSDAGGQG